MKPTTDAIPARIEVATHEVYDNASVFPDDSGILSVHGQKAGKEVTIYKLIAQFNQDVNISHENNFGRDEMQLIFNLRDDAEWDIGNGRFIALDRNEVCLYRNADAQSSMAFQKGSTYSFQSIQLPTSLFTWMLNEYFPEREASGILRIFQNESRKMTVTPEMTAVLTALGQSVSDSSFQQMNRGARLLELFSLFLSNISGEAPPGWNEQDAKLLLNLISKIRKSPQEDYSAERVAREYGMSVSKLNSVFRNTLNTSLHAYVVLCRLEQAIALLETTDLKIGEVARMCGYTNMSHFSRAFQSRYGLLPREYKRKVLKND